MQQGSATGGGDVGAAGRSAGSLAIEFAGVAKRYGSTDAVVDFSLHVAPGSVTSLIGPSGCGKSTVLRLCNGLVRPDAGEIRIGNVRLDAERLGAIRRRTGYVIQDGGLFPHLNARDNVALMARHVGWDRGRTNSRVADLLELVELPRSALARFPTELSGGQNQRVSLMRALMLDPGVLLLDEPMAALDPMIRSQLQTDLKRIFAVSGATVILVSHDLAEAAYFADQLVLMREGRAVQRGAPEELLQSPANEFVERFVRAQRVLHLPPS